MEELGSIRRAKRKSVESMSSEIAADTIQDNSLDKLAQKLKSKFKKL
jgi:hypothetical protein